MDTPIGGARQDAVLDVLEGLTAELNEGKPVKNAHLADAVERLRVWSAGEGAPAQSESSRAEFDQMLWALESLERSEAGAAGAFVIHARAYVRLCRGKMPIDRRDSAAPRNAISPNVGQEGKK